MITEQQTLFREVGKLTRDGLFMLRMMKGFGFTMAPKNYSWNFNSET